MALSTLGCNAVFRHTTYWRYRTGTAQRTGLPPQAFTEQRPPAKFAGNFVKFERAVFEMCERWGVGETCVKYGLTFSVKQVQSNSNKCIAVRKVAIPLREL